MSLLLYSLDSGPLAVGLILWSGGSGGLYLDRNFRTGTVITLIINRLTIPKVIKFSYGNITVKGNVISARCKFCSKETII